MIPGKARQVRASGVVRWQPCSVLRVIMDPIFGQMALVKFPGIDRVYVKPWSNVELIDSGAKYSKGRTG